MRTLSAIASTAISPRSEHLLPVWATGGAPIGTNLETFSEGFVRSTLNYFDQANATISDGFWGDEYQVPPEVIAPSPSVPT